MITHPFPTWSDGPPNITSFLSYSKPLFQSKFEREAIDVRMIFILI